MNEHMNSLFLPHRSLLSLTPAEWCSTVVTGTNSTRNPPSAATTYELMRQNLKDQDTKRNIMKDTWKSERERKKGGIGEARREK